jgi:hypothetical protein
LPCRYRTVSSRLPSRPEFRVGLDCTLRTSIRAQPRSISIRTTIDSSPGSTRVDQLEELGHRVFSPDDSARGNTAWRHCDRCGISEARGSSLSVADTRRQTVLATVCPLALGSLGVRGRRHLPVLRILSTSAPGNSPQRRQASANQLSRGTTHTTEWLHTDAPCPANNLFLYQLFGLNSGNVRHCEARGRIRHQAAALRCSAGTSPDAWTGSDNS